LGFNSADPGRLKGLTWISSLFVQRGFWHLISNVYFIYQFGRVLEDLLGPVRFLLLFLLGGASGNLMMLLFAPKGQLVVGASGAVMALMTTMLALFQEHEWFLSEPFCLVGTATTAPINSR